MPPSSANGGDPPPAAIDARPAAYRRTLLDAMQHIGEIG
jgi:hypothetical protein